MVKSRLAGANPDQFLKLLAAFIRRTILLKFDVIRFIGYGVIAEKSIVCECGRTWGWVW